MIMRLLVIITTLLLTCKTSLLEEQVNTSENVTTFTEEEIQEYCAFCEEEVLTNKQRCEELLVKILIDEKNYLDDGLISKEVYELQIEPINEALDCLEVASDEEADILYKVVLLLHRDWLEEDIAAGEEVDEGFYQYIEEELLRMN